MSDLDLNKLTVFARVVEAKTFTAAANTLRVPKSSVSRAIAQLEESLGVRLLQRTTRTLALTEAGLALYDRASRALTELSDATSAARELQGTPSGVVRVTAPVDVGTSILVSLIQAFSKEYPSIHVEVSLTGRLVDLVEEGFDLAFRASAKLSDSSLVVRKLCDMEAALFASPTYLAGRPQIRKLEDLAKHDVVIFQQQRASGTLRLIGPKKEETIAVTGVVSSDNFSFVARAVVLGMGVALIPSFLVVRELSEGQVVRVLPNHVGVGASLYLVHPTARHVPHRVRLFRDFAIARLGGKPLSAAACTQHAKP